MPRMAALTSSVAHFLISPEDGASFFISRQDDTIVTPSRSNDMKILTVCSMMHYNTGHIYVVRVVKPNWPIIGEVSIINGAKRGIIYIYPIIH